jgi:hypothetical protein
MAGTPLSMIVAAATAVVFGVLTVVSGARALFGGVDMGAVVPFVLWFNFAAGFAYVLAGVGLWRGDRWGPGLCFAIAATTGIVFAAFLWHIQGGGAYEERTFGAMILRVATWTVIAAVAIRNSNVR